MAVTDAQLRSYLNKKRDKELFEADELGLFYRVCKTGKITWSHRYTFYGKKKKVPLCAYPDISLKQARKIRDINNDLISEGRDPRNLSDKKLIPVKRKVSVLEGLELIIEAHPEFSPETIKKSVLN